MKRLDIEGDKIIPVFYGENFTKELERIKILPSRKYNPDLKRWEIPLNCFDIIKKQLSDYQISPELQSYLTRLETKPKFSYETLLNTAKLDDLLPCGLELREHQKDGIKWLLKQKSAILADDMGLGKTITSLVVARTFQGLNPEIQIIVICPVSLRKNWLIEAEKVGVSIATYSWGKLPEILPIPTETETENQEAVDLQVIPKVKPINGIMGNQDFLLLVDEAHYAQNLKSQRTQKLLKLINQQNCLGTYLLTGTPMKNGRPINLYPLLLAIDHVVANDKKYYSKRYCDGQIVEVGRDKRKVWDESGATNLEELAKITSNSILRRMKHEVLTLPPKVRIVKPIELESTESKAHLLEIKTIILDYWSRVKKGEVSADAQALVQLGAIRRINSKYKVPCAMEMIQELLEQNQSVVVFTEFIETTQLLYNQIVNEYGDICVLLIGDTKDRQSVVDRFQSGKAKVFIGTSKAGGVGITLTKASNLILIDRPWTPGDTEQAEDRCYRIGQTESVFCYWLQLGEVDQGIDDLLGGKQANISTVLNGKAVSIKASNLSDLAKNVLEKYKSKSK